jgi:murein tripeptide amidase MpaA
LAPRIDGGIHAREWVSPASVLYMIRELVENEDPNNSVLTNFDLYVLPVANPDG